MKYNNYIPYYMNNSIRRPIPNNRLNSGFLFPFALGFVSSPLIFGATRPRPPYYPVYGPNYFPYY